MKGETIIYMALLTISNDIIISMLKKAIINTENVYDKVQITVMFHCTVNGTDTM